MRRAPLLLALLLLALPCSAQPTLERVGFGSCLHQARPQRVWNAVYAQRPDLFIMLGDNIYGDSDDMEVLARKYKRLGNHPDFALLKKTCPIVATWDDHDYGLNDAGADFGPKEASKKLMLDFFGEPQDSPRRRHPGVYTSYLMGPPGRQVQIILLDTRWSRTALHRRPGREATELNRKTGKGPYLPSREPSARMLGEEQWKWLEEQLRQPAQVRLIGSSVPVIQEDTGWETWENFPAELERFYALLRDTRAEGVILLSGDSHRAEFSRVDDKLEYPLWELNSSGLTENARSLPPNKNRLGEMYVEDNFGMVHFNWELADPQITLEIRDPDNDLVMQNTLRLSQLRVKER